MRGLTALVTVMSLLIVAGLVLLAYGVVRNIKAPPAITKEMAPLMLPTGSTISHMTGFQDTLALHVKSAGGETIYLVDPRTGAIQSTLPVQRQK